MATFRSPLITDVGISVPARSTLASTAGIVMTTSATTVLSRPFNQTLSGKLFPLPVGGGIVPPFFPGGAISVIPTPTLPPPSPTATASDLQLMISAIPIAQSGRIISADFHNALRLALTAIANRLGVDEPEQDEITITNAPRLSPVAGAIQFQHDYGLVKSPAAISNPSIRGWMEMELPHGARIKKMVVFATKTGTGTLKITLRRQKIIDATVAADLIVITVPNAADSSRGIEGDVTVPGTGAGAIAIEEYRIVNNREEKYLLAVDLIQDGSTATSVLFHTVQIVCGR
jgi:hypothetical protein